MSYLKIIETTEMIEDGPNTGLARIQYVNVVKVLDQFGEEWFPEDHVTLEIVTPAKYDPDNVYKVGATVKATTATFVGDEDVRPMKLWARWQYRLNGSDDFIDATKFEDIPNEPQVIEFVIPENTADLKFFTACKEQGNTPEEQEYGASVLEVVDVVQLEATITQQPESPVNVIQSQRSRMTCVATGNYELQYTWQFKAPDAEFWVNASLNNLAAYYPDGIFTLADGVRSSTYHTVWVAGPAPTEYRCRVRDQYEAQSAFEEVEEANSNGYDQKFSNIVQFIYPED